MEKNQKIFLLDICQYILLQNCISAQCPALTGSDAEIATKASVGDLGGCSLDQPIEHGQKCSLTALPGYSCSSAYFVCGTSLYYEWNGAHFNTQSTPTCSRNQITSATRILRCVIAFKYLSTVF